MTTSRKGSEKVSAATAMAPFHPAVRDWFMNVFRTPTRAQEMGWPAIARGEWTLIFAPTGSGKTLTAFLWALDRLMFAPRPEKDRRCRVVYISPLKALAVDVERNLRAPLTGIANLASERGEPFVLPSIAIRTGDTPQGERARFLRDPADILITTPESIYLMLTSNARDVLRGVETIIIDEVHALVPNKRGAHLALSLERLQRIAEKTPQRIGLSATQNPLEEVAKYLGGFAGVGSGGWGVGAAAGVAGRESGVGEVAAENSDLRLSSGAKQEDSLSSDTRLPTIDPRASSHPPLPTPHPRKTTIINTGEKKQLTLHVEVPVEEMAKLNESWRDDIPSGPAGKSVRASIWPAIHPRLLELIRAHRSTLIFVNSRRLAERLAGALNELAGELLVQAHHGSIARAQRIEIEDNLKSGRLPALVATSSLELGIDMGAIDLVIQIEAPPSIASGMQRIGRASHQVGTVSEGIIFPKFRGDLLACAAVTDAMHRGAIEPTRYPRNPLDVLAQQVVAMIAVGSYHADELFALVRQAAPFSELSRTSFDGVLDMLSGLYPSDEFAELRPRVTWDRVTNILTPRPNAKRVAITSGGTIPDRGLFGVFLAGGEKVQSARVGELDEEMVFECRVGETFLLGASTWRIEEITHDRVLVTPAPGEPGKMPFWKADAAERTVPFGEAIGALVREIGLMQPAAAIKRLTTKHDLGELAAKNFIQYLDDQHAATGAVPDDRTIVIERVLDDLGDWRVCVLTPFGGRIHAPWAMAVTAKVRNELQIEVETMWSDDGFIVRFPDTDAPPRAELLIPDADEIEQLVVRQLGSSSMFAAKFREAAARALLLPRFRPDRRQPLWQQRKRAYDLLQVASRFGSFPIILETYREVLRDVFDVPALVATMKKIQQRTIRVVVADTEKPSPFAGSLLFRYVANFIYDGDAPLAERRAQALAIDQAQLRELLGEPELRELLDADALHALEIQLQHLDDRHKAKSLDALHDLLLRLGDLSFDEIVARSLSSVAPVDSGEAEDLPSQVNAAIRELLNARRIIEIGVAREKRFIAIEDASRYRDALGTPLPPGLADRYLQPVADPTGDLVLRYARTHGPFTPSDVAHRYGLGVAVVHSALERFVERGRLIEGEFRPGGTQREWCDNDVLSAIRRRSLAKLRKEVELVETKAYVRLINHWQFVTKKRRGLEGLLEVIEALQGVALPASIFESEILSARIDGYKPSDLDTLSAAGEIVWTGVEPLGDRDGRIALYLTDHLPLLHSPVAAEPSEVEQKIVEHLRAGGASFFAEIQNALGGFANDVVDALWNLVWRGVITNDTFHALRAYTRPKASPRSAGFRSRRVAPPSTQGRWSLVQPPRGSATERASATAHQLLARYGIVVRESAAVEGILGGFSAIYPVLKGMEESGRTRRGYFVAGFGATQFGSAGALDLLRSYRDEPDEPETVMLAATDPANPYGSLLKWPASGLMRVPGASVILVNGMLGAYVGRGEKQLSAFLPENEPVRGIVAREIAKTLASLVTNGTRRALLIAEINDAPAAKSDLGSHLAEAGFVPTAMGYQMRAIR